jgi:hypothetical protein
MESNLLEKGGINNSNGYTDKETQLLGINMYLGLNPDESVAIRDKFDKGYSKFVDKRAIKKPSKYRDSINGTWNREVFDGFSDIDEDFDDFLTKKSRERKKKVKELKGEGLSKKDARAKGKELIPKDKAGKLIGNFFKGVGKFIVKTTLAIPRGAFLLLLSLNYRGIADKNVEAKSNPIYKDKWNKVKEKWKKMGGELQLLEKAIAKGGGKKPLMCSKKCKAKLATQVGSKFTGADGSVSYKLDKSKLNEMLVKMYSESIDEDTYANIEPTTTAIAVAVSTGGTLVGIMAGILGDVKNRKNEKIALERAEKEEERSNKEWEAQASAKDKEELRLAEKQIESQTNPKNAIMNNPDLTNEQKKEALEVLNETLAVEETTKSKKWILYVGMGVVALLGFALIMKKNK